MGTYKGNPCSCLKEGIGGLFLFLPGVLNKSEPGDDPDQSIGRKSLKADSRALRTHEYL